MACGEGRCCFGFTRGSYKVACVCVCVYVPIGTDIDMKERQTNP